MAQAALKQYFTATGLTDVMGRLAVMAKAGPVQVGASYYRATGEYRARFENSAGAGFEASDASIRNVLGLLQANPRTDDTGRRMTRALNAGLAQLEFARRTVETPRPVSTRTEAPSFLRVAK